MLLRDALKVRDLQPLLCYKTHIHLVSFQQFQDFYPSPTILFHFAQKKVHHARKNVQNQIPQKNNINKINELIFSMLVAN